MYYMIHPLDFLNTHSVPEARSLKSEYHQRELRQWSLGFIHRLPPNTSNGPIPHPKI